MFTGKDFYVDVDTDKITSPTDSGEIIYEKISDNESLQILNKYKESLVEAAKKGLY